MSRNAIAAMAVIFVSGFAGCAATARADDAAAIETPAAVPARSGKTEPLFNSVAACALIVSALYVTAATRRARRQASRS